MIKKCACNCGAIYDSKFNFCPYCGRNTEDNIKDAQEDKQEQIDDIEAEEKTEAKVFEYDLSSINKLNDNTVGVSENEDERIANEEIIADNHLTSDNNSNDVNIQNNDEYLYHKILQQEVFVKRILTGIFVAALLIYGFIF